MSLGLIILGPNNFDALILYVALNQVFMLFLVNQVADKIQFLSFGASTIMCIFETWMV